MTREGRRPRRPPQEQLDGRSVAATPAADLLGELSRRRAALELIDALDDLLAELELGLDPTLATRAALRRALGGGQ